MPYQIFLVEDHPVMREAYASVIGAEPDFDLCGSVESAEEAIEALRDDGPCDLVVTDIRLPGLSGIDLVGHLRASRPDLPVVVVSGHEDDVHVRRALDAGAAQFVSKGTLATSFVTTLRSVVAPTAA